MNDHGEFDRFKLIVTKCSNGENSFTFDFDESEVEDNDKGKENKNKDGNETPSAEQKARDEFAWKSNVWTTTSIAFFQVVPILADQNYKHAERELADKLARYAEDVALDVEKSVTDEATVIEYTLDFDELPILANKMGSSTQVLLAAQTMNRSTLGALVSEYEAFLAGLLRTVALVRPEAFVSEGDQISVGELSKFDTFEDAKSALVNQKIEDLLHSRSHVEVLGWIEKAFGVNLTSDKILITEFTEICQRRHLFTHAGGVVNRRYLRICLEAGVDENELPKMGETLHIDRKYLRRATARVYQIGYFTLHLLWQKLFPKDIEKSLGAIVRASHDYLENDLTKMARRLCNFGLGSRRKPSDRTHAYLTINKALSYLYEIGIEEEDRVKQIEHVLSTRDWSITSPTIDLALACVRRQYDDLVSLATAAAADGVSYVDASTWVVFKEVRETDDFIACFRSEGKGNPNRIEA